MTTTRRFPTGGRVRTISDVCYEHNQPVRLSLTRHGSAGALTKAACVECINHAAELLAAAVEAGVTMEFGTLPECNECGRPLLGIEWEKVTSGQPRRYCDQNCKKRAQRHLARSRETGIYR